MTKYFLTFISLMLLLVCSVSAQPLAGTFSIVPKLGVNISTLTGKATMVSQYHALIPPSAAAQTEQPAHQVGIVSTDHHMMRFGWTGGVEAQYQMSDRWALSLGAMYSLQGAKFDDVDMNGITMTNASVNLHNINIPVMLSYYVAGGFALKAGLQPGVCFFEDGKCDIMAGDIVPELVVVPDRYTTCNFSVPVGMAYEFGNVVVDMRYNIGISNLDSGRTSGEGKHAVRNSVFLLTLGYIFDF